MENTYQKLRSDERGIASMIIVVLVMFLLTLLVLGMARNASQEQRQALDRQLSAEALYAAESGVNDTVNFLRNNLATAPAKKENCDPVPGFPNNELNADGTIQYTCILYDTLPTSLEFAEVGTQESKLMPVRVVDEDGNPVELRTLTFSWEEAGGNRDVSGCDISTSNFAPKGQYPTNCSAGMLRAELIDIHTSPTQPFSRNRLINYNDVAFFVPQKIPAPAASYDFTPRNPTFDGSRQQGKVVEASCRDSNTPKKCVLTYRFDIGQVPAGTVMFLRLKSVYKPNTISVKAEYGGSGSVASFSRAQVMIDSTGKATDVLRRIQVRVPLKTQFNFAENAIKTKESICKLFEVYPGTGSTPDGECNLN